MHRSRRPVYHQGCRHKYSRPVSILAYDTHFYLSFVFICHSLVATIPLEAIHGRLCLAEVLDTQGVPDAKAAGGKLRGGASSDDRIRYRESDLSRGEQLWHYVGAPYCPVLPLIRPSVGWRGPVHGPALAERSNCSCLHVF